MFRDDTDGVRDEDMDEVKDGFRLCIGFYWESQHYSALIQRICWPSLQSEEAEDVVSQAVAPSVMLSEKEAEVDELEHVLNREQSSDLRAARAFSFPWRRGGN